MIKLVEELRAVVARLLADGEVKLVIGYENGSDPTRTTPLFVKSADQVQRLTFSPFAINNLAKYLLDYQVGEGKIGIIAKGCDSRAIVRLLQDKQFPAERLMVIGVSCPGQLDSRKVLAQIDPLAKLERVELKGEEVVLVTDRGQFSLKKTDYLMDKCKECETPRPVLSHKFIGPEPPAGKTPAYEEIARYEAMSPAEKAAFWDKQFEKCIRCYACRNVCPACNCRQCCFDQAEPNWLGKGVNASENHMFQLTRAMHVAGRCVDCGECDRVCPMDIPLRLLNRKVLKDIKELFSVPTPGIDDTAPVLGAYRAADPDEFH